MSQMIGQKAPNFSLKGVSETGEIRTYTLEEFAGKYVVLFFYPLDFTFVCPLELLEMSKMAKDFSDNNAVVLGVSVDSEHTHAAWRTLDPQHGGVGALNFPLLADVDKTLIDTYSVANASPKIALRATVIIDPTGTIRVQHVNDLPLGRNPSEILRLVKSIEFHEQNGDVCPPNWQPGEKSLKPNKESLIAYQES